MTRRLAVTYVLPDPIDAVRILGYYSLSAYAVESVDLPPEVTRRLPRYPNLPAILLGRLAVAEDTQGQGIGTTLLLDALARIWSRARAIGCHLVVVDALHDRAAAFYAQYGFVPFRDHPERLHLPVATIDRLWRG